MALSICGPGVGLQDVSKCERKRPPGRFWGVPILRKIGTLQHVESVVSVNESYKTGHLKLIHNLSVRDYGYSGVL